VGNSTLTLQAIFDGVSAIGDLNPIFNNTGGWADEPALTIANDVVSEFISVRFPWKWNRIKIPPFALTSYQQDYATNLTNIGWVENGRRVDINNSTIPPPDAPIFAVRDLDESSALGGWPFQYCWQYNRLLEQHLWPGPGVKYTDPIGTFLPNPQNPFTNILDVYGNILVLVQWGITGLVEPVAVYPPIDPSDPNSPPDLDADISGQIIEDGTCAWMVVDPAAQGFRFNPRPPQTGNVWLMRLYAQKKAPLFTSLQQKLDPIPDDHSKWFRDGCVAYSHRYSSNPNVKARFEAMKADWFTAVDAAARQNDREDENKGFFPDRPVMTPIQSWDTGPIPFRWGWR
jgi:hypothetical protein